MKHVIACYKRQCQGILHKQRYLDVDNVDLHVILVYVITIHTCSNVNSSC